MASDELLKNVARAILRTYHPGEEWVSSQDSAYAVSAAREAILLFEQAQAEPSTTYDEGASDGK